MGASLSIEQGRDIAEVIRDVYAHDPSITGLTQPREVAPGVWATVTNKHVPGSAGYREIKHVNGQVRSLMGTFDYISNPRCEGTLLKYDLTDGQGRRTEQKRVWQMPLWN